MNLKKIERWIEYILTFKFNRQSIRLYFFVFNIEVRCYIFSLKNENIEYQ